MAAPFLCDSTARDETFGKPEAVLRDISRTRVPDAVLVLVLDAMTNGLTHGAKAKWLARDESVQRQREYQRLALGLFEQLVELIDDHIGELAPGMVAMHLRA